METFERRILFVGGLSPAITEGELESHFSQYCEVNGVKMMKDKKTKLPKGYAYVYLKQEPPGLDELLNEQHIVGGRRVDVQVASRKCDKQKWKEEQQIRRVFIKNIPLDVSPEELEQCFSAFGKVKNAYLINDYYTGKPKGQGYLHFEETESVMEVLQNRVFVRGQLITCLPYVGRHDKAADKLLICSKLSQSQPSQPKQKQRKSKPIQTSVEWAEPSLEGPDCSFGEQPWEGEWGLSQEQHFWSEPEPSYNNKHYPPQMKMHQQQHNYHHQEVNQQGFYARNQCPGMHLGTQSPSSPAGHDLSGNFPRKAPCNHGYISQRDTSSSESAGGESPRYSSMCEETGLYHRSVDTPQTTPRFSNRFSLRTCAERFCNGGYRNDIEGGYVPLNSLIRLMSYLS